VVDKIVCDDELYLPNWGNGVQVDANTAADFLEENGRHCHLEKDWLFQWGYTDVSNP